MIQEKEKQSQAETQEQGENWMQIAFAAQSENEGFARTAVAAFVSCLDPTIDELADIKTAVSEAVTNCIIHGYNLKGGTIWLELDKPVRTDVVCGGYGRGTRNQRHQTGAGTIVYDTTGSGTFRHGIFFYGSLYGCCGSGIFSRKRDTGCHEKGDQIVTYGSGVGNN